MPNRWEHDVTHLTMAEIQKAIKCDHWQEFRVALKGRPTERKLVLLEEWLNDDKLEDICSHCTKYQRQIQVDNYINALKRGGQLDLEGNVVR